MFNNDVLRSLHRLLDLPDVHLAELAAPFGEQVEADLFEAYLKEEGEDGFRTCPDRYPARCLDGLAIQRHGCDELRLLSPLELPLNNNVILGKLWVASELKEEDLRAILANVGFPASRPELSALLRKPDHGSYRIRGDQLLCNFLKGLTLCVRG